MRSQRILVAVALAVLGVACTGKPEHRGLPPPPGIDRSPVLAPVASCEALEQDIEDTLVLEMRSLLERGYAYPVGVADGPPVPTAGAAGPSAYTTTNSQVEGVGEADFVQNDGTRIAVVTGDRLHLATSWPPEALSLASSAPVEGWPHELFLAGDRAVVFSAVYVPRALEGDQLACPIFAGAVGAAGFTCGYWAHDVVKITTFDVADLAAPKLVSEAYLPGSYVSARRIGDRVRLVTSDTLPFPDGVQLWVPVAPGTSEAERRAALDALAATNEALIRARTLDDWLRHVTVKRPGLPDVEVAHACTDFSVASSPVRPGILTVATYDVPTASLVSRSSVLAEPGVVYASAETLYVATSHWWWWPAPGQRDATYLHAFDLRDPDRAAYVGSGVVDGHVRDQYGLDEFAGALRVATTVTARVDDGTPWGSLHTAGRVSVLQPKDGALALVGETPEFGGGESVFGTRFLGARGFVITARQVDPLFTFDLADPAHPTVVGALEMPGFVSYLHPIDDTHLLGIGRAPSPDGGPMQVKIALFDVADLAHPIDVATALVGEGWSWSDALWDPKAFTWFGARSLLAIPFVDYGPSFTSDLRLFHVDAATGIQPAGTLSMADAYAASTAPYGWYWSPYVRRSILAESILGDAFVYAVSDAGIRSAKVAELPAWLATIRFPAWQAP